MRDFFTSVPGVVSSLGILVMTVLRLLPQASLATAGETQGPMQVVIPPYSPQNERTHRLASKC